MLQLSCTQVPHSFPIFAENNAWLEFLNKLGYKELKMSQISLRQTGERQQKVLVSSQCVLPT